MRVSHTFAQLAAFTPSDLTGRIYSSSEQQFPLQMTEEGPSELDAEGDVLSEVMNASSSSSSVQSR